MQKSLIVSVPCEGMLPYAFITSNSDGKIEAAGTWRGLPVASDWTMAKTS